MSPTETNQLYHRLRQNLLGATRHHRSALRHPGFATDIHHSHLRTCQRQMGALRQAYRRTQEAIAWEEYRREQA